MADVLSFRNEKGDVINEINFKRTIKGIPSLITSFKLRNESESLNFIGRLVVAPSFGRSYSEDAAISESGNSWTKNLNVEVPASSDLNIKMRILPITTPSGSEGSASVTIVGSWET